MSKIIPNGAAIERTRILSGMTAKELAQRASVPPSSIVRAERGQGVSVTTATGICRALDRSFDDLFQIIRTGGTGEQAREGVS